MNGIEWKAGDSWGEVQAPDRRGSRVSFNISRTSSCFVLRLYVEGEHLGALTAGSEDECKRLAEAFYAGVCAGERRR